jgi:hypothetical protein
MASGTDMTSDEYAAYMRGRAEEGRRIQAERLEQAAEMGRQAERREAEQEGRR